MSIDQLPPGFAPYEMVMVTPGVDRLQRVGCYYDRKLALDDLDRNRRLYPENTWGVLYDGGLLEETAEQKPLFKILRQAA